MTVDELIVFLAHAPPVGDAAGNGTAFGSAGEHGASAEPPDEEDGGEAESEAADGKEDPMPCHPENKPDVTTVPAAASMMRKKTPRMVVIFISEKHAHSV